MNTQTIEYVDGQQKLIGELLNNKNQGSQPAIIIFHAFEGRGEFTMDYAKKLADLGYMIFIADMYGDAKVADTLPGCFELIGPHLDDRNLVRRRALLAYETLLKQANVDNNKIGAIGFCFGGMCMLEIARAGADLKAGVSLHGILAKSELPTQKIKTKLLLLAGFQDPQVPPEQVAGFGKEMKDAGVEDWTLTYFGNAKHSFTDPNTGTFDSIKEKEMGREYNEVAARRSFEYAASFFEEHL